MIPVKENDLRGKKGDIDYRFLENLLLVLEELELNNVATEVRDQIILAVNQAIKSLSIDQLRQIMLAMLMQKNGIKPADKNTSRLEQELIKAVRTGKRKQGKIALIKALVKITKPGGQGSQIDINTALELHDGTGFIKNRSAIVRLRKFLGDLNARIKKLGIPLKFEIIDLKRIEVQHGDGAQ